jgi:hypothetical protein
MAIQLKRTNSAARTMLVIVLVALSAGFLLAGCTPPGAAGQTGAIQLSLGMAAGRTLLPSIDMTPASYAVSGTGPSGATFTVTTAQSSVTVPGLAFGQWTVSVSASNAAGTQIALGSGTVSVATGQQSSLAVTVTPLSGNGTLSLTATWIGARVGLPTVSAQLLPMTGSAIPLSFTVGSGSATAASATVPAGYYTLTLQLLDNGVNVYGAVDVVRIVKGQTTSGTYDFSASNQVGGSIAVAITPVMSNPLSVSITGQTATLAFGANMTVTAALTGYSGNVTYVWYVNGVSQATGSSASPSFTFGSALPVGAYRLDVTAFSTDGLRAGSANASFQVQ